MDHPKIAGSAALHDNRLPFDFCPEYKLGVAKTPTVVLLFPESQRSTVAALLRDGFKLDCNRAAPCAGEFVFGGSGHRQFPANMLHECSRWGVR